jgi:hypothetical protein
MIPASRCTIFALLCLAASACQPANTPKTAEEKACALHGASRLPPFPGMSIRSTAIADHDKREVAGELIRNMRDADQATDFSIKFGFYDVSMARKLRQVPNSDFEQIMLATAAPNLDIAKLVTFDVDAGGSRMKIGVYCAMSILGDLYTVRRPGVL